MEKHFVMALPDFQAIVDRESIHLAPIGMTWSAGYSTPEGSSTTTIVVLRHETDYTVVRKTTIETYKLYK